MGGAFCSSLAAAQLALSSLQSVLPAKLMLGTGNDTASTCHVPDRTTSRSR